MCKTLCPMYGSLIIKYCKQQTVFCAILYYFSKKH